MVNKRFAIWALFTILFSFSLFAQTDSGDVEEDDNFYLLESEEGVEFIQKFSWDKVEGAMKYRFTIEQKASEDSKGRGRRRDKDSEDSQINEDGYIPVEQLETEQCSVELSLAAGNYRYKIEIYNFLGNIEFESQWFPAEIIKAYQPEIRDASPTMLYMEEQQNGIFSVTGVDLRPDAQYFLRSGLRKLDAKVIEQDDRFRHVRLQFDVDSLDSGIYTLVAKNVGGLESQFKSITVKFKKPTDFDISVGFSPFWFLYDSTMADYFGSPFNLLGANLRMTFFPVKFKFGYFGAGLSASGTYLNYAKTTYSVSTHFADAYLNLVYQKTFGKRNQFHFDAHVGAGLVSFLGTQFKFPHDVKSDPLWSLSICAAGGVSLQYYILNRLYVEAGVDYVHGFMSDMVLGYVKPIVSVGWQF